MTKQHFYILKIKRNILPFAFLLFTLSLLLFSKSNLPAVKQGLNLWATAVVPSLFPFFVATELLMHTNMIAHLGNLLNKYMKPLFHVRGEGSFAFLMGILSGYPVGAKIACEFRKKNICSKEECERLLSFTNNSGPLFIIGTVGISMFQNTTIGILLFITHLLACITVGILFRFWKYQKKPSPDYINTEKITSSNNLVTFSNLGEVIAQSITSSISTICLIGGFVVIFSSILSILKASGILSITSLAISPILEIFHIDTTFAQGLLTGILEITNGIQMISNITCKKISINILFSAFLLGFGGISIFLQVLSITSKTDLSIKPYIYGKLLQGILATIYTSLAMNFIPFFNFDLS